MLVRTGPSPSSRMWSPDASMRALLDAVPNALAVIEPHGHIAYHNAAWAALGAHTAPYGDLGSLVAGGDHAGSAYLRRLAALDGPLALPARRLVRSIQDALAGRSFEERLAYRMRRPDGEEPFEAILSTVPTEKGNLVALQHVDLGDRERMGELEAVTLERGLAVEDLRARERRLVRRLAAIGQELHTPITPVRLELHLLQSGSLGPLTPEQTKALALAARNVERWAAAEQEFLRLPIHMPDTPQPIDLAAVAREAVDGRQTQALQQGVRLMSPADAPALPAMAPPDIVRDALDRFLDHALDASPAGTTVAVEAQHQGGEASVAVVDSGPGLSARDLRSAFEPWGGKRPDAGRDLSLHYASVEVGKAGGRVWAESDGHGQGLLLGFAFPLLEGGGFPARQDVEAPREA